MQGIVARIVGMVVGVVVLALHAGFSSGLHAEESDSLRLLRHIEWAMDYMDRNLPDEAIRQWDSAVAIDPTFTPYRYERTVCLAMAGRYQEAIDSLQPIYRDTMILDRGYQLLGNCFDYLEDTVRSLEAYTEGLQACPASGRLHYEMGARAFLNRNLPDALRWWVRGTRAEPKYATNYYWICKGLAASPNKIWAVLYGELFMNLEPNSRRTKEISALLFETWNKAITLGHPDDPINFCSESLLEELSPHGPAVMNFPTAFEFTTATSAQHLIPQTGIKERLTIRELIEIRMNFIRGWKASGYMELYPNDLLRWHDQLLSAGWLDEYLWWIYAFGDPEELAEHYRADAERYDTMLGYLSAKPGLDFTKPQCVGIGCD